MEYSLERQSGDAVLDAVLDTVDLSGLGLSALYHAPLLSLVRVLKLDHNHLRRPLPQLIRRSVVST